jgi:long-chain acyl-CoA synthetase
MALMSTMDTGTMPSRDATGDRRSMPILLREATRRNGARAALRWKQRGIWEAITWTQYAAAVREAGCALLAHGLRRGERVAVLSENRPEWLYVDLGAQSVGGVVVGIDVTEPLERVADVLNDCGARILFVDDEAQLETALTTLVNVPKLERVVHLDESLRLAERHLQVPVVSFAAFRDAGARFHESDAARWDKEIDRGEAGDAATIVYTAGQTGPVSGVLLTHRDLDLQTAAIARLSPGVIGDEQLSILPLAQVVERCFSIYRPLITRSIVNFGEGPSVLLDSLREVAPHVVLAVPQIWEMLQATIATAIADAMPIDGWGFRAAIEAGFARADALLGDRPISLPLKAQFFLARHLVLNRTRTMIGLQRARVLISAEAPMSRELSRWYRALDLRTIEAGLTDSTGGSTSRSELVARENPR